MRYARRLSRIRALLVLGTTLALPLASNAQTGADLGRVRDEAARLRTTVNGHLEKWDGVRRQAEAVRVELPKKGDKGLDVPGSIARKGDLDHAEMLGFLPIRLIDDLNRRIYIEYERGFRDWNKGYYPPLAYSSHSAESLRWTITLFDSWDRDVWFDWNVPQYIWQLYVKKLGGMGTDVATFERMVGELPPLHDRAGTTVTAAAAYRPEVQDPGFWGWLPWKKLDWSNEADWNRLASEANGALRTYHERLTGSVRASDGAIRSMVESAVRYRDGNRPVLEFLVGWSPGQTGTGNGWSGNHAPDPFGLDRGLWQYYFDLQVFQALPRELHDEVMRRLVNAYFRGARDAKYGSNLSSSSGGGYDYGWGSSYGTGDGYGYGGDRRYGTGTGRGRTPRAWNTGSGGTGSGGSGTGGSGTGGWGSGGTGSGGSSGSGGTGSGSSGSGSSGSGTGSGGFDDPWNDIGGTGSGSGSGTGSGTGTGTGSGGASSGTGTGN